MADIIVGSVNSVVFNQGDYYILSLNAIGRGLTKAKGSLYGLTQIRPGVPIKLIGKWVEGTKYGQEFQFHRWEPWAEAPTDLALFLSLCVEGFADFRFSDALANKYGLGLIEKLSKNPGQIQSDMATTLNPEILANALLCWGRMVSQRDLSVILKDGGLTTGDIQTTMYKFGSEAPKIIVANPFRLLEIFGVSFAKVDRMASRLGVVHEDPRRLQGAILWALQEATRNGHLYLKKGELDLLVRDLIHDEKLNLSLGEDPAKSYNEAIRALLEQKSVVLEAGSGLYLPDFHGYERKSADLLSKLLTPATLKTDVPKFLEEYERAHKITFSEAQKHAVELLSTKKVLVITGLPGTGKTTCLKALVYMLENSGQSISLMAPTGIAAKRLSYVTGHVASTVHRALKYDGMNWGHHDNNRYMVDAVILDEASMMDQELFYRLLVALRPDTRLVLVGDDAQLPSVGPGNVLRELVGCEAIPHVRLTEIFRQSIQSEIVTNSHRINSGKMPELSSTKENSEFRFVRLGDEEKIAKLIVSMASKLKERNANFQVLAPKYDGVAGIDNLNNLLRDALNPAGPMEWARGKQKFRLGDRLMVTQNDYKLNVYNGDMGKLVDIGKKGLVVRIHGIGDRALDMNVQFTYELAMTKLKLAYAISVHRSQGSEFETVIMPIVRTQGRMLQRNLLYTSVTRARKRVWLIGEEASIQKAIENNKVISRNTVLAKTLIQCLASGVPVEIVEEDNGSQKS